MTWYGVWRDNEELPDAIFREYSHALGWSRLIPGKMGREVRVIRDGLTGGAGTGGKPGSGRRPGQHYKPELREKIREMLAAGMSQRAIRAELGCSKTIIQSVKYGSYPKFTPILTMEQRSEIQRQVAVRMWARRRGVAA